MLIAKTELYALRDQRQQQLLGAFHWTMMLFFYSIFYIVAYWVSNSQPSVLMLARMVQCVTKRSPFDFVCYGCYCGLGGEGTPIDEIDRCCQKHDNCYNEIFTTSCCWENAHADAYINAYDWSCDNSSSFHNSIHYAKCDESNHKTFGLCIWHACECDAELANCLANNVISYPEKKPEPPLPSCPSRNCSIEDMIKIIPPNLLEIYTKTKHYSNKS